MAGIRQPTDRPFDCVEVRFKNNHKDFYRLPDGLEVTEGDIVAVEGQPGHDVGIVSLTGELCRLQMRKHRINPESESIRKLFRRAKEADIDRWADTLKEDSVNRILDWYNNPDTLYGDLLDEDRDPESPMAMELFRAFEDSGIFGEMRPVSAEDHTGLEEIYAAVQLQFSGGDDADHEF
jgi:hypothetical protein